ncbi:MAG: omptin family outer membrane protease [Treponema sp.]|nr:omptin family outer membrane protease [Treponema sp.]
MKKFFFALIFAFVGVVCGFSDEFSLSVEPVFGVRNGQVDEYVFLKECDYDDDKLSELNWDLQNEFLYGAKIDANLKRFFVNTQFSLGIPRKSGTMIDSDWMNVQLKNASDYQYKTNYSVSDNYLESDFDFSVKLGADIPLGTFGITTIDVKPFVGFDYNSISFIAKGGTAWYGNTNSKGFYSPYDDESNRSVYNLDGDVISYERKSYIFWLGFETEFDFPNPLSVSTGFQVSPYLYAESIDTHLLTKRMYGDKTPGFFSAFKWHIAESFKFTPRLSLVLDFSWLYVRVLRGDDYIKTISATAYTKSTDADGGAGEHYFDFSLGFCVRVF